MITKLKELMLQTKTEQEREQVRQHLARYRETGVGFTTQLVPHDVYSDSALQSVYLAAYALSSRLFHYALRRDNIEASVSVSGYHAAVFVKVRLAHEDREYMTSKAISFEALIEGSMEDEITIVERQIIAEVEEKLIELEFGDDV